MELQEYFELDGVAMASLVRRGEVHPSELLDAAVNAGHRLNPFVNAVVTDMEHEARQQIKDKLHGPLNGVPFLLKDLRAMYKGVPTTAGSRFMRSAVADHDSTLVARYKKAGLVIFGKTNTPEFGGNVSTEPVLFGPTRNPWDLDRIAGGSSGGSAAAVAAGIVPMAHASDGGGSIRIPASCCGLVGLKPTRGRNPAGPYFGEAWSGLSVEHAVTRTVRDSAVLLDSSCGPESGDPYWPPPRERPYAEEVASDPGRLRIAFSWQTPSGVDVHPDCRKAVEDVATLCELLGHDVEHAAPRYNRPEVGQAIRLIIGSNMMAGIRSHEEKTGSPPRPEEIERVIRYRAAVGDQVTGTEYALALQSIHRAGRRLGDFFRDYDILITPTVATPPPPLGTFNTDTEDVQGFLEALYGFIPFTAIFNATGQPAISLPLARTSDGRLPIGVQFAARFGDEATLFRLAAQLEAERPWPTYAAHLLNEITQPNKGE